MESGYHANFCVPLEDEYKCSICQGVYRQPMQLACGHRLCKSCLENHRKIQEQRSAQFSCPIDREEIEIDQVFPDRAIERYVLSLAVKCNNTEHCSWTGELRGLENHLQKCQFKYSICDYCSRNYFLKDKQDHMTECDHWPVKCVNCCGAENIPRNEMALHLQSCPLAKFPCNYQYLGCTFTGTNMQMKVHLGSAVDTHLSVAILKMTSQNEDLERKLQTAVKKIEDLEKKVETSARKSEDLEKMLHTSVKNCEDMEKKVQTSAEQSKDLERKVQTSVKQNEDLERKVQTSVKQSEDLEKKLLTSVQKSEILEKKLESSEKKLEVSEKKSEDFERRFERFVVTKYTSAVIGKTLNEAIKLDYIFIIFPVRNYNNKLQNCNIQIRPGSAINYYHATHCSSQNSYKNAALSDVFFSHLGEYKLRLEAVFTTSLYLYIHVLNPPLECRTAHTRYVYPFPAIKYTIHVLHPLDESKHVKQSWAPDKRDEISMGPEEQVQPFTGQNTRRYSVCYFEYQYIKDEGFIIDDTLYFMCKID